MRTLIAHLCLRGYSIIRTRQHTSQVSTLGTSIARSTPKDGATRDPKARFPQVFESPDRVGHPDDREVGNNVLFLPLAHPLFRSEKPKRWFARAHICKYLEPCYCHASRNTLGRGSASGCAKSLTGHPHTWIDRSLVSKYLVLPV